MRYYAYILKSKKDGRFYYGNTWDLKLRLKEHNKGLVKATKYRLPFEIYYYEEFGSRSEAYKREQFFKTIDGYNWLKTQGII